MCLKEQFIQCDLNLPNHSNELSEAEQAINKLKTKYEILVLEKNITNESHDKLYNDCIRVLDYVGRLSMSVFDVEDKLENLYFEHFHNSPELAKKLFFDHYETLHYQYNLLKNRCFKLLDDLDELYQNKFRKNPPNWEI